MFTLALAILIIVLAIASNRRFQFFTSAESPSAKARNNILYHVQLNGPFWGGLMWFGHSLHRTALIPGMLLMRRRIGSSVFSVFNLIQYYLIMAWMAVYRPVPASGLDDNIVSQSAVYSKHFYQLTLNWWSALKSPLELFWSDPVLVVFLWLTVIAGLYNLIQEFCLPEKLKPTFEFRGDSYLANLPLFEKLSGRFDARTILQLFVEPALLVVMSICISFVHLQLGWVILYSGLNLFFNELKAFNNKGLTR